VPEGRDAVQLDCVSGSEPRQRRPECEGIIVAKVKTKKSKQKAGRDDRIRLSMSCTRDAAYLRLSTGT